MNITAVNAQLSYFPDFIRLSESYRLFEQIQHEIAWRQEEIILYGKKVTIPRLQAWYGDTNSHYSYSNLTMQPVPWLPVLQDLKKKVEQCLAQDFNAMLANLYRNQSDSVAWHSDDEKELSIQPVIASLSFGEERNFLLKHKVSGEKLTIPLKSGSLFVMAGETQQYWQHCLPRTKKEKRARINLTFRKIVL